MIIFMMMMTFVVVVMMMVIRGPKHQWKINDDFNLIGSLAIGVSQT